MWIDFIKFTLKSLTSKEEGFSFRKLSSLVVLGLVIYLHVKYVNSENVLTFLLYDFGFIAVLLGLLNLDRFIQAKFGSSSSDEPEIPGSQPSDNTEN